MEQEVFNIKELSFYLGISRYTVSSMVKNGEIPFIPWRGSRKAKRFRKSMIDKWLDDHTAKDKNSLKRLLDARRRL